MRTLLIVYVSFRRLLNSHVDRWLTSGCQRIEADPPRHAEGTEALDHADESRFAASVSEASPGLPEEAGRAGGRDDLALAGICCAVAGIQQFHESNDAVEDRGTIQVIDSIELFGRGLPGVLHEFGERVLGFQICQAGTGHARIGNQQIDVSNILAYDLGNLFEIVFLGDVGTERDNAFPLKNISSLFFFKSSRRARKSSYLWYSLAACSSLSRRLPTM